MSNLEYRRFLGGDWLRGGVGFSPRGQETRDHRMLQGNIVNGRKQFLGVTARGGRRNR